MENTQPVTKVENLECQLKRKNGEPPARFHALEYLLLWEPSLGFLFSGPGTKAQYSKEFLQSRLRILRATKCV